MAGFTPEERECISRNISKKVREGWDRDQAVAASIAICAPRKARSKQQLADAMGEFQVRDPASVCGFLWFHGTQAQREAFGRGTEGRGRDEKPPKRWWDD